MNTYIVWMHKDGEVIALGHWEDRAIAEAYARYQNRANPCAWCEVRIVRAEYLQHLYA